MTTDPDAIADAFFAGRPRGSRKLRTVRKGSHVVLSANGLRKWPHGKWFVFVVESNRRGTVHMRRDGFDWFCTPADVVRWRRLRDGEDARGVLAACPDEGCTGSEAKCAECLRGSGR